MVAQKEISSILTDVAMAVLQQLAFAFPEEADESILDTLPEEHLVRAVVHFSGMENGSVALTLPMDLARELYDSIVGDDSAQEGDEVYIDSVKELANVVAGHFLSKMYGDDLSFKLSPPEYHESSRAEISERADEHTYAYLQIESAPFLASAHIGE